MHSSGYERSCNPLYKHALCHRSAFWGLAGELFLLMVRTRTHTHAQARTGTHARIHNGTHYPVSVKPRNMYICTPPLSLTQTPFEGSLDPEARGQEKTKLVTTPGDVTIRSHTCRTCHTVGRAKLLNDDKRDTSV